MSGPDDEPTLLLDEPVKNTKQRDGRPLAWTVVPRIVRLDALARGPRTTDELDQHEVESA